MTGALGGRGEGMHQATAAVDAAGVPLFLASMIEPNEIIVGMWKPSPWFVALRSGRVVLLVAVVTAAGVMLAGGLAEPWGRELVQLGALAVAARVAYVIADWASRVYVLTDRRVLRRRGVISPTVYSQELRGLRRVQLERSAAEVCTGIGTVTFSCRDEGPHDAAWLMVANARELCELVRATKDRYGK